MSDQKKTRIFLVGPMGAGKTTIGKQLARALNLEFVDSDHEIEKKTGASIPLIFDVEGEAGFRKRESAAIEELTQRDGIVLATGGGVVMTESNRLYLSQRGTVVYLYAPIEKLLERTGKDRNRPLLLTENPLKTIEELLKIRDPLYRSIADHTVETDSESVREAVKSIVTFLKKT